MYRTHLIKDIIGRVVFEYNIQIQRLWFIYEKRYTEDQYTAEWLRSAGYTLEEINPKLENE